MILYKAKNEADRRQEMVIHKSTRIKFPSLSLLLTWGPLNIPAHVTLFADSIQKGPRTDRTGIQNPLTRLVARNLHRYTVVAGSFRCGCFPSCDSAGNTAVFRAVI